MSERISYAQKLKDPRWQRVRLLVLERDHFMCVHCQADDNTLHVHHAYYEKGKDPWEYPPQSLHTLCETCHHEVESLKRRFAVAICFQPHAEVLTHVIDMLEANSNYLLSLQHMLNALNPSLDLPTQR